MDIVDKLRSYKPTSGYSSTMRKAADEIESLRKTNKTIRVQSVDHLVDLLNENGDLHRRFAKTVDVLQALNSVLDDERRLVRKQGELLRAATKRKWYRWW